MEIRNQLAVCPYDHNHLVKKGRMQQHLVKCRQNHLHEEFKVCPFNACHRLHPAEFKGHLNSCPDKECLEREIYNRAKEQSGKCKSGNLNIPIFNNAPPPCTEDWDQDDDFQEDNTQNTKENIYAVVPPPEPESPEEMPPLQPRILHTTIVSAMKKQNHEGKGLRAPKHLPKALEQHWPRHGAQLQNAENPDQEHAQELTTETTNHTDLQRTEPNVPTRTNICIEPSLQTTDRALSSESNSICDRTTPKISDCMPNSTSSTQALPSQKTAPNKTLTLKCTTLDKLKPSQTPPEGAVLTPISPLTEKMRSLGRGMLFKFQVHNSEVTAGGGSVVTGSTETRGNQRVTNTDPAGGEKHKNCQRQLSESPGSSDNTSAKNESQKDRASTCLQPADAQNASCDYRPDPPPLGRGRGILALKFFREKNKNQEPSVGNRAIGSPAFPLANQILQ